MPVRGVAVRHSPLVSTAGCLSPVGGHRAEGERRHGGLTDTQEAPQWET